MKTKTHTKHRDTSRDVDSTRPRSAAPSRTPTSATPPGPAELQSAAGNQAVQRLLRCGAIQAKLTVGSPDDPYEREADRVAEQVASCGHELAPPSSCEGCTARSACRHHAEEPYLQAKGRPGHKPDVNVAAAGKIAAIRGGGEPLPNSLRASFEPRFGRDFSNVRVHTGLEAAQAAGLVRAEAFTCGLDVVFAHRAFDEKTSKGRKLIAHELTHVVQQRHGGTAGEGGRKLEAEADVAAEASVAGRHVGALSGAPGGVVQRQPERAAPTTPPTAPTSAPGEAPRSFAATLPTAARTSCPTVPPGQTITFRGVVLADDADFVRYQLEEMVRKEGRECLSTFPRDFQKEMAPSVVRPTQIEPIREQIGAARAFESEYYRQSGKVPAGVPWSEEMYAEKEQEIASIEAGLALAPAIAFHLHTQAASIESEIGKLFAQFSLRSELILRALLDESERRVEAERIRYGIEREEWRRYGHIYSHPIAWTETGYSMQQTVASRGLAGAAQDLAERKERVAELVARRARLVKRSVVTRGGPAAQVDVFEWITDQAEYDRLGTEIDTARNDYERGRASAEARYPVLAAFARERGTASLRRIAQGPESWQAAEEVGAVIYERLGSIKRVRDALDEGEVDPWTFAQFVTLTMAEMGVQAGTMYERVIRDEAARRSETGVLGWILAGIALVLGIIAAIPSGGSSLAVAVSAAAALTSAGLSGYLLVEHIKEYTLESAQATTAFDRARSISQDEPSAFWLALDIVFFVADLGAAAQAFRRLAPLAIQALRAGDEALEGMRALREAADEISPELGSRVMRNIARLRGGGEEAAKVAGVPGRHEAKAVARAGRELAEEAARPLAEVPTRLGGHTVKVVPGGHLVRCTTCGWLREEFAMELAGNRELALKVFQLEDEARAAALAKDAAAAELVAERARGLADELEAIRRTREIRLYRGAALGHVDDIFLMDRRLVVDMPYTGRGAPGTNAAGWLRSQEHYWGVMLSRHPDAFSPENLRRIRGDPPFAGPVSPRNDPQFRLHFPQYDVRGLRGQTLIHHHIGGGGQAVAVPAPLHPGSGGIHNVERAVGIWQGEDPVAEVLQRLLEGGGQ